MVPFNTKLLDLDLMTNSEIQWLNDYHQEVYEKISPYLSDDDLKWLKEQAQQV